MLTWEIYNSIFLGFYLHLGMFYCYLFISFNLYLQGPQTFRPVFSKFSTFVVPNINSCTGRERLIRTQLIRSST